MLMFKENDNITFSMLTLPLMTMQGDKIGDSNWKRVELLTLACFNIHCYCMLYSIRYACSTTLSILTNLGVKLCTFPLFYKIYS